MSETFNDIKSRIELLSIETDTLKKLENISDFYNHISKNINETFMKFASKYKEDEFDLSSLLTKTSWSFSNKEFTFVHNLGMFDRIEGFLNYQEECLNDRISISVDYFEKLNQEDIYNIIFVFLKYKKEMIDKMQKIDKKYKKPMNIYYMAETTINNRKKEIEWFEKESTAPEEYKKEAIKRVREDLEYREKIITDKILLKKVNEYKDKINKVKEDQIDFIEYYSLHKKIE